MAIAHSLLPQFFVKMEKNYFEELKGQGIEFPAYALSTEFKEKTELISRFVSSASANAQAAQELVDKLIKTDPVKMVIIDQSNYPNLAFQNIPNVCQVYLSANIPLDSTEYTFLEVLNRVFDELCQVIPPQTPVECHSSNQNVKQLEVLVLFCR